MISRNVPVSPVTRPARVNHPPGDQYDEIDWPRKDRPKEIPKPTPAIRASALAIRPPRLPLRSPGSASRSTTHLKGRIFLTRASGHVGHGGTIAGHHKGHRKRNVGV